MKTFRSIQCAFLLCLCALLNPAVTFSQVRATPGPPPGPAPGSKRPDRPPGAYEPQIRFPGGLTVFYNGARRSKIVPCGCQGRNLGGIDKESAVIGAVRNVTSPTLNLDAGGFLAEFADYELRLQSWYLLEALSYLKIDVMNIGYPELQHGIDTLQHLQREFDLPLISANVVERTTKKPFFETHRIINVELPNGQPIRVGVIGVTAPGGVASRAGDENFHQKPAPLITEFHGPELPRNAATAKWVTPLAALQAHAMGGGNTPAGAAGGTDDRAMHFAKDMTTRTITRGKFDVIDEIEAIRDLAEKLRNETELMILLCYAGPGRTTKITDAVPLFDVVVCGDADQRYEPFYAGPGNNILMAAAEHDGRFLGKIDLAFDADGTIRDKASELIPIDQHYIPDPRLTILVDTYMRNKSKLPKLSTALEKLYVGANRCASCHVGEFDQWKATRHATAMKTLVEAGKQNDSQCQKCHTTAFGVKGGFTDLLVTPNLAGIQCESCHGPGGRHIEEEKRIAALAEAERVSAARKESMIMNRDAKFCMECHDAKNDPDFDFARDMKFIDHTTTPPARMKKTSEALKLHSGER